MYFFYVNKVKTRVLCSHQLERTSGIFSFEKAEIQCKIWEFRLTNIVSHLLLLIYREQFSHAFTVYGLIQPFL